VATYLKVAFRTLYREKLYATLNIAGLAFAVACASVIGLYLESELTYDRHNVLHERLYRVANEMTIDGNTSRIAVTAPPLGAMLAENYPEVLAFTRFQRASVQPMLIRHGDDAAYWDDVYFADDSVFDLFTHEIVYGDPKTALHDPASVAVSRTFARRYFGDANPIGETIENDAGVPVRITLVFEDLPENSHLKYDALFSFNVDFMRTSENPTLRRAQLWNFGNFLYTYVLMPEGYDPADFDALAADFYEKQMASVGRTLNSEWRAWLEPLTSIHLSSDLQFDRPTGNRYYVYGFAAVGIFILLVACINYVNLATARATKRARSVGLRKVFGSGRWPLAAQFLGEAMLFALVSAVVGVVLVEVALTFSPIDTLVGRRLHLDFVGDPAMALAIVGGSLLLGVVAGLYPALYLSSWAPLGALVGQARASRASVRFRQVLVFAQFAISIGVISATLLMAAQMRFIDNRALGFDKENRIMITMRGVDLLEQAPQIMGDLTTDSRILGASLTALMPGQDFPVASAKIEDNDGATKSMMLNIMQADEHFVAAMGMRPRAGRDFSRRLLTDVGTNFIVNDALVRAMGWHDPLGKRVAIGNGVISGRVIGIVDDFNFKSLHSPVQPLALMPLDQSYTNVSGIQRPFVNRILVLNVAGEGLPETLHMLRDKFAELDPSHPFEYRFVDESLNALYASERSLMRLIGIFAAVCILIACLGLYGLSAFTTEQRTKEIGVRKVLGASAFQIVLMLSRATLLLILAGAAVASVAAYLAIDEWLTGFAYRAGINPLIFVAATAIAALVAFATIALQAAGTARADPADSLRYE
jgi:putative ABC transport system permease protein